jgi:hypothetical protein
LPYEDVENAIKKTGKKVNSGKVIDGAGEGAVEAPKVVA